MHGFIDCVILAGWGLTAWALWRVWSLLEALTPAAARAHRVKNWGATEARSRTLYTNCADQPLVTQGAHAMFRTLQGELHDVDVEALDTAQRLMEWRRRRL